eukprot:Plantae.Rhodophyta-Rhodochaete_pulchella.ctg16439.p1 GENE.Plantae.Rhodophyta-Rhodochaete_pulchella.ctg16439~~Plantae.Rhodophyta-Rhodochaete_pulchella.ctg16439.p1  ORF type:complete len:254 (-),score=22.12 Plantae.Rhodophyta-Rhodochaete_pulchella.ctg16439:780-1496(-)
MGGHGRTATLRRLGATDKVWRLVDAKGQVLGRLASQIAVILMGKHKPLYLPSVLCGDPVVVINARHIAVTGRKLDQKKYHKHSGYPGGLNTMTLRELLDRKPTEPVMLAVKRMLPDNRLRKLMLDNLKIYPDGEHQHHAQQPIPIPAASKGIGLGVYGTPEVEVMRNVWNSVVRYMPEEELETRIRDVESELSSEHGTTLRSLRQRLGDSDPDREEYLTSAEQSGSNDIVNPLSTQKL